GSSSTRPINGEVTGDQPDPWCGAEGNDVFAPSTVEMVAIQATEEAKTKAMRVVRRRSLAWLALLAAMLLSATATYAVVQHRLSRPNRELVRDLPLIEHVDEYRRIDSLDFLKQLE